MYKSLNIIQNSKSSQEKYENLKKLTSYNKYDKKDGGILVRALDENNQMLRGENLEKKIIEDYI